MNMENEILLQEKARKLWDLHGKGFAGQIVSRLENLGENIYEMFKNIYDEESDSYADILEYWFVSDWLGARLAEHGEPVIRDFYGFALWGRCCSGQSITLDAVIQDIAAEYF